MRSDSVTLMDSGSDFPMAMQRSSDSVMHSVTSSDLPMVMPMHSVTSSGYHFLPFIPPYTCCTAIAAVFAVATVVGIVSVYVNIA